MKFTTIYLGDNKIELFNSIIGRETVKVNGEIVSSRFSLTGTEHHFSISENDEESACRLVFGLGLNGVVIDLYKDEKPIIESSKIGCLRFVLVVIVVGILIGLLVGLL